MGPPAAWTSSGAASKASCRTRATCRCTRRQTRLGPAHPASSAITTGWTWAPWALGAARGASSPIGGRA
eukprot:1872684-Alexandrium_andersonii.AAC.1